MVPRSLAARLRNVQNDAYAAIDSCDQAIAIDESAGKAWYRRGVACMSLQQYGAARKNLTRAATLLPSAREIREALEECKKLSSEKAGGFFS